MVAVVSDVRQGEGVEDVVGAGQVDDGRGSVLKGVTALVRNTTEHTVTDL